MPPRQVYLQHGEGAIPLLLLKTFCGASIPLQPLSSAGGQILLPLCCPSNEATAACFSDRKWEPSHSAPLNDHQSGERGVGSRGNETIPGTPRTAAAHLLHTCTPHTGRPSWAEHRYSGTAVYLNTALLCAQEQMWGVKQGSPRALGILCHQAGQLWGAGDGLSYWLRWGGRGKASPR